MPALVELKCTNCGSELVLEKSPGQVTAARCPHCKSLFALPASGPQLISRPQVEMPRSLKVEEGAGTLKITRRWLGPATFVILFFAIVWNGFMIVWNSIALGKGIWPMAAFGILHTAIGLSLIYVVLAQFFNTTVFFATPGWLQVKHGPIPWPGNKRIASDDIRQLYCTEKVSQGKNGPSVTYRVEIIKESGRREILVHDLPDSDQAVYLEQQLERYLNLVDTPVEGAFRG